MFLLGIFIVLKSLIQLLAKSLGTDLKFWSRVDKNYRLDWMSFGWGSDLEYYIKIGYNIDCINKNPNPNLDPSSLGFGPDLDPCT